MRIRWRGLELPSRVVRDEAASTDTYGRFTIEPFEPGFGTTIGNALRRVLLSSLEGAAITTVKIDGVSHEFTSIDGVMQDVTEIILNIKGIVLVRDSEEVKTIVVERDTAGDVRAGDIVTDASVDIINEDHLIATLTNDVHFRLEMTVGKGRGYITSSENRQPEQPIGIIPVDSVFSPVWRVRFRTVDMRVGQRTNFDRLCLEVWTDGTIRPEDALVEGGTILRKHLNPFVMYHEIGDRTVMPMKAPEDVPLADHADGDDFLDRPISALNLSVRASHCLDAAKITTIRELVALSEAELLRFRSFGMTSLREVHRKLADANLCLTPGTGTPEALSLAAAPEAATGAGVTDGTDAMEVTDAAEGADPPGATPTASNEPGPMEAFTVGEQ